MTLKKLHFPPSMALPMIGNYIKNKLMEQVKAVAFIIIYLVLFKLIVLQSAPENAVQVAFGIGLVILGLAMFLDGLFLGLMPLGERVGVQLPQKTNIWVILIFGLFLGFGATLAEPAISTLRQAGEGVTPWDTPLLYRFLELETNLLVWSVGAGVGVAVACGMARFYFGMGLKPFIFILTPILLIMSVWFSFDPNLKYIINLAWDTGGVTTGPVTVPLVLAMGIGISKASGKSNSSAASGFGVVTLASLFPVLGVFVMGLYLNATTPQPVPEKEFFEKANRAKALEMIADEGALKALAFQRGSFEAREAYFGSEKEHRIAVEKMLEDEEYKKSILGTMKLSEWHSRKANEQEKNWLSVKSADILEANGVLQEKDEDKFGELRRIKEEDMAKKAEIRGESVIVSAFAEESRQAVYAVVPLVLLLLLVLVFLLKDRLKTPDEVILGIVLSLAGMAVLTTGIRFGLSSLGNQIGRPLPQVYSNTTQETNRFVLKNFDVNSVVKAYNKRGQLGKYIYIADGKNNIKAVPFDNKRYNRETRVYEHIEKKAALWSSKLTIVGFAVVCLFAFGMGYGSTVAEPALNALGITVEEMTVGTIKRKNVVGVVSVGVGFGLLVGVVRLITNMPACWLLVPGYILLTVLTFYVDDEFAALAWDSGGVTTGPITVPLVLAMGLGIGGGLNVQDGFGIVSMASMFPIMTMLLFGIRIKLKQKKHLSNNSEVASDGK